MGAIVDDLQTEEDHHVPKLNGRDVSSEDGTVLQSSDEERKLQENYGSVIDNPVTITQYASQEEHKDGKDVKVCYFGLKRTIYRGQDD